VSGSLIDYADRFVDPALAFGIGLGEWLAWTTVLAAEGAAFNVIIQYWTDAVPVAAWSKSQPLPVVPGRERLHKDPWLTSLRQ
jgi:amino acid permease